MLISPAYRTKKPRRRMHKVRTIALLFFLFPMQSCEHNSISQLSDFLRGHMTLRPGMQARDVYKLLYQGVFGVGHLISDPKRALAWLEEELMTMDRDVEDPLFESCDTSGMMLRINLRPFSASGASPDKLIEAMIESTQKTIADTSAFIELWERVGRLAESGAIPLDPVDYRSFNDTVRAAGYPVIHHSKAYSHAYRPAYRVVLRDVARERFPDLFR